MRDLVPSRNLLVCETQSLLFIIIPSLKNHNLGGFECQSRASSTTPRPERLVRPVGNRPNEGNSSHPSRPSGSRLPCSCPGKLSPWPPSFISRPTSSILGRSSSPGA